MAVPEQVSLQQIVGRADAELMSFLDQEIRAPGLTPDEARTYLMDVLPGWGERFEDAAASVAADLYEQQRVVAELDRVVPHQIVLAKPVEKARWGILSSWGLEPVETDRNWGAAFKRIVGGAHRTIADAHRNTTMANATTDRGSRGWRRVGRGGSTCDFCRMLIGRGDVYKDSTVKFRSHDNCRCSAESAFHSLDSAEMNAYVQSARKSGWTEGQRRRERERVNQFIEYAQDTDFLPEP